MHCERVYFYAHPEQPLREVEWIHYGRYLDERIKGKPTQYITHKQEFYGRDFRVTPAVLIPRPETELLVETVLNLRPNPGLVIDVGTGSGCIAISLKAAQVFGVDLSSEALKVAQLNAQTHRTPITLIQADLLTPFQDAIADVVVSNPPYIPLKDLPDLQREVRDWEPHMALFAGTSGMAVYERLIPEAKRILKPGGLLALELGFGLADSVAALVPDWHNLQILPDLAGIPRVLACVKP
jgi:release factor glutamine methyltransferase